LLDLVCLPFNGYRSDATFVGYMCVRAACMYIHVGMYVYICMCIVYVCHSRWGTNNGECT